MTCTSGKKFLVDPTVEDFDVFFRETKKFVVYFGHTSLSCISKEEKTN